MGLPHLPSYRDFEQSAASAQAPLESRVVLDAAQSSFTEAAQLLEKVSAARGRHPESDSCFEDVAALKEVVEDNQAAIRQFLRSVGTGVALKKVAKVSASPT